MKPNNTRDEWRAGVRDDIRDASYASRHAGWRIGVWIVVVIAGAGLLSGAIWAFKVVTSDVKGEGDQTRITNDGRNRVNAQEWFHGQYNQIKAADRQIGESAVRLAEATTARNEADRLFWRDNLSGQRNRCEQMVAAYNAEANKVSRGKWRDPVLPFQIDGMDTATDCQPATEGNPR